MHKDISNKYLKNAEEKLNAAKHLLNGNFYRDSVSRSYYSMFFAAKALLALKGVYPQTHRGVVAQFGLQFVKNGFIKELYGRTFRIAKELRETADYDVDIDITQQDAKKEVKKAEKFLTTIKKAVQELERKGP